MNAHEAIRELAAVVERQIGSRTIRYVLVVALPDHQTLATFSTGGNASSNLTEVMLVKALLRHRAAREDDPDPARRGGKS